MEYVAFMLGLASSLHCIGMCGPLLAALPGADSIRSQWMQRIEYHSGRISAYAMLGLLSGWFGLGIHWAGFGQWLTLISGLLILVILIGNWVEIPFWKPVQQKIQTVLYQHWNPAFRFGTGMINGFLPCGVVYLALFSAIATGSPMKAVWFMILFGMGTVPLLLIFQFSGQKLLQTFRGKFSVVSAVLPVLVAGLLILRGLNLGIPYISPAFQKGAVTQKCH